MIEKENDLPVTRQCKLLGLNRSMIYYQCREVSKADLDSGHKKKRHEVL